MDNSIDHEQEEREHQRRIALEILKVQGHEIFAPDTIEYLLGILGTISISGAETTILPKPGLARLRLVRPLVMIDLETTDKEVAKAKIIEVAAVKLHPDGRRETFETLVNPGFPISKEIEELTNISNADLEGALPFENYAPDLLLFIEDCDLGGYNFRNFDGPVLAESLLAAAQVWAPPQETILDVMEVFHKAEPRSLEGALRFFCGREHTDAHRAYADVVATFDVLGGMLDRYQGLPDDVESLIAESRRDKRIDMAGCFVLNDEGIPCFGFGKHKGQPCHTQRGYTKWMLGAEFSEGTKRIAEELLQAKKSP